MTKDRDVAYGIGTPLISLAPKPIITKRNPTPNDVDYDLTTQWLNFLSGDLYSLIGFSAGLAQWELIGGNSGYPITPYVVGIAGQAGYQTIQAAIDAAHAAGGNGYVFVQPGTYNENLTFYDGITINGTIVLSGFADTVGVFINGVHTPPLHGGISFNYVDLTSPTDIFFSNAAGDCQINISNAAVTTDNGYTFNLPNWTGILGTFNINCVGTPIQNNGMIVNYGGSQFACFESGFGWGTGLTMHTSGDVFLGQCESRPPWVFETGSTIDAYNHEFQGPVTFAGDTTGYMKRVHFITGAAPAITMSSTGNIRIALAMIDSTNNPAIDGAGVGTLTLAGISFVNNASIAGTLTLSHTSAFKDSGVISAGTVLRTEGDVAGLASTVSISNVVDETLGAGVGAVLMKTGNPGNSSGWLKIYNGTNVRYVPYWTNISP